MIKTIIVPAFADERDPAAFAAGLTVARAFAAHIDFLHARLDVAAIAAAMTAEGSSAAMTGGLFTRMEEEAERRENDAKSAVHDFCARQGLPILQTPPAAETASAAWRCATGPEPQLVVAYGRAYDLIVIAPRRAKDGVAVSESLEAALLDSGRPLLIPPERPLSSVPDVVAIAWKETTEAARAVTAALPFIARAREVIVMTVEEGDHATEPSPILDNLRWRGCRVADCRLSPGPQGAAETLLTAASNQQALLVMGGYGHSRLREWVFGGFTHRVLRGTDIPVLISH